MKPTPAAIRKHNPRQLTTVGLLPNSLDQPGITSKPYVSACLSFCWGQTPTELRLSNKPADAPISNWLEQFQPLN